MTKMEVDLQVEKEVPYRVDWMTTLAPPIDGNLTGNDSVNGTLQGIMPNYKFYQVLRAFLFLCTDTGLPLENGQNQQCVVFGASRAGPQLRNVSCSFCQFRCAIRGSLFI